MLGEFNEIHRGMDSGAMAQRSVDIAQDVRTAVRSFRDAFDPKQMEQQQRAFTQLSGAMRELAGKLDHVNPAQAAAAPEAGERVEHDLLQLRVLTRDTLVLLERISQQLANLGGDRPALLSEDPRVRAMAFPEPVADLDSPVSPPDPRHLGAPAADEAVAGLDPDFGRPRMFRERP
jgi:hypothetical protein